jgi:hypothetical protein
MTDELLGIIKAGGRAAGPLALASWGAVFLPRSAGYPAPFGSMIPWICFAMLVVGALTACFVVARDAISPPKASAPKPTRSKPTKGS